MTEPDKINIASKFEILKYSIQHFDKAIVTIASGALGISFAFIDKIVDLKSKLEHRELLITAWYLFAIVIFISMLSHFISIYSNRWAIANHVYDSQPDILRKAFDKKNGQFGLVNLILSVIMMIILLSAFFRLIGFIEWNL
jgi:hypothetical protein